MSKYNEILSLAKAWELKDNQLFKTRLSQIIATEKIKKSSQLKDRFIEELEKISLRKISPSVTRKLEENGEIKNPQKSISELIITPLIQKKYNQIIWSHENKEVLNKHNFNPITKILLKGETGNGKTSFAESLAFGLNLPIYLVKYSSLLDSYLGKTQTNLQNVFKTVNDINCVLFFDEFDSIGIDRHSEDVGEIKRIVNSLLLEMDGLSANVVFIAATNCPELLDRAVYRRFEEVIEFPAPNLESAKRMVEYLQKKHSFDLTLPELENKSYSVIENEFKQGVVQELMKVGI